MTKPSPTTTAAVNQLINLKQVEVITGFKDRTLRRYWESGKMPKPIKVVGGLRWNIAVIQKWIADGCPQCADRGTP